MKHEEYEWLSNDKKKIYAQSWQPDQQPDGILLVVHGLGEHSGRYELLANEFNQYGLAVLSLDMVGNGRSEGKRGHIKNYQRLMEQVDLLIMKSEELFPGKPRILFGHSWGGNLVLNYAMMKDPHVDALIASSPWLRLAFRPPAYLLFCMSILKKIAPSITVKGPVQSSNRCHNPAVNEEVQNDPLMHRWISIRMFEIINRQGIYAMKNIYKINRPLLLMHGNEDRVTSYEATEEMARNTSHLTRLKIWDGLYHELISEFENKEIFLYIISWLEEMKIIQKKTSRKFKLSQLN